MPCLNVVSKGGESTRKYEARRFRPRPSCRATGAGKGKDCRVETRRPKPERNPNPEIRRCQGAMGCGPTGAAVASGCDLRPSFGLRVSGIRIWREADRPQSAAGRKLPGPALLPYGTHQSGDAFGVNGVRHFAADLQGRADNEAVGGGQEIADVRERHAAAQENLSGGSRATHALDFSNVRREAGAGAGDD